MRLAEVAIADQQPVADSVFYAWLAVVPEGTSDHDRQVVGLINLSFVVGAAIHVPLATLFWALDAPGASAAAALLVLCMFGALALSRAGHPSLAFHLVSAAVLTYAVLVTVTLGWASGFHLQFVFALLMLAMFSRMDLPLRVATTLGAGVAYSGLAWWCRVHDPLVTLDPVVLDRTGLFNLGVLVAGMVAVISHYSWLVQQTQEAQRTAESELERALRHHKATVDHMADGLFSVDADGRVLMLNPSMGLMLNDRRSTSSREETDIPKELLELAQQAMAERQAVRLELNLPGSRIGAAVASPLRDKRNDRTEGAVVLVRDITVDKQVDRMKTELTSMVSHELRTPMTSVLGFAKLVRNKLEKRILPRVEPGEAKVDKAVHQVRENLDIITAEAERLTDLISDVLDIAKMEAGHVDWSFEPLDPSELVERAVAACTGLFADDVQLGSEVEDGLPPIDGDRDRLHQVLVNLVSNAHKFTEHGSVTVRAERAGDAVRFSVEDTGQGIPQESLDTVFHKFQQLGSIDTSKPKGTGLGLAISKQIVESHGGRIEVDSHVGHGSVFSFEIPAAQ